MMLVWSVSAIETFLLIQSVLLAGAADGNKERKPLSSTVSCVCVCVRTISLSSLGKKRYSLF